LNPLYHPYVNYVFSFVEPTARRKKPRFFLSSRSALPVLDDDGTRCIPIVGEELGDAASSALPKDEAPMAFTKPLSTERYVRKIKRQIRGPSAPLCRIDIMLSIKAFLGLDGHALC
jgi:hypothetical protein